MYSLTSGPYLERKPMLPGNGNWIAQRPGVEPNIIGKKKNNNNEISPNDILLHSEISALSVTIRLPPIADERRCRDPQPDTMLRESLNWRFLLWPSQLNSRNPWEEEGEIGGVRGVGGLQDNMAH